MFILLFIFIWIWFNLSLGSEGRDAEISIFEILIMHMVLKPATKVNLWTCRKKTSEQSPIPSSSLQTSGSALWQTRNNSFLWTNYIRKHMNMRQKGVSFVSSFVLTVAKQTLKCKWFYRLLCCVVSVCLSNDCLGQIWCFCKNDFHKSLMAEQIRITENRRLEPKIFV